MAGLGGIATRVRFNSSPYIWKLRYTACGRQFNTTHRHTRTNAHAHAHTNTTHRLHVPPRPWLFTFCSDCLYPSDIVYHSSYSLPSSTWWLSRHNHLHKQMLSKAVLLSDQFDLRELSILYGWYRRRSNRHNKICTDSFAIRMCAVGLMPDLGGWLQQSNHPPASHHQHNNVIAVIISISSSCSS